MKHLYLKRGEIPLFIFFLLQHLFFLSQAQNRDDLNKIFSKGHYSFTLVPFLDQKASITKNIDKYGTHATVMHGFEAGFSRYSHLDEDLSVIVGIFFGAFGRNFNYAIPGNELVPPKDGYLIMEKALSREFDFVGSVPIRLEKRWFAHGNKFWDAQFGLTIRYTPTIEEYDADIWNGNYEYFQMHLVTNPKKGLWLNYDLGGGYNWILKNNNILKTGLVLNMSFTSFVKASYQFTLANQPKVEGSYEVKGSYIGLSFGYLFTRTSKR